MHNKKVAIAALTVAMLVAYGCDSDRGDEEQDAAVRDAGPRDGEQDAAEEEVDASEDADIDADTTDPERDAGGMDAAPEQEAGAKYGLDKRARVQTCLAMENPPERLTLTGCFVGSPAVPAPSLVPFEVATPLWSDGALKDRYVAIPDGTTIGITDDGDFIFPVGTVLVKTFRLGDIKVETRLFMQLAAGQWRGVSYDWTKLPNEGFLVGAERRELTVGTQHWTIPSRADCLTCHTESANFALGPQLQELDFPVEYAATGRTANQLDTWNEIGLFSSPVSSADGAGFPRPDDQTASLTDRARGYLHVNCSGCHRPPGYLGSLADLRAQTPLAETGICNKPARFPLVGAGDFSVLATGAPERSAIVERMQAQRAGDADAGVPEHPNHGRRMPPLGVSRVDEVGVQLVSDWIRTLDDSACQPTDAGVPDASVGTPFGWPRYGNGSDAGWDDGGSWR